MISPATIDDAPGVAALGTVVSPHQLNSVRGVEHRMRTVPADARRAEWKVERGGALVGYAVASLDWLSTEPGRSECYVQVHPEHRGQGLGSALWDVVQVHLAAIGARATTSSTRDDAPSVAFAERRGFRKTSSDSLSATDPTRLQSAPEPPDGVALRPLADWLDDPRPIYELDLAGVIDEPGDNDFSGMTFELWRDDFWSYPDWDYDISTVAVVDGRPVSMSMLLVDADAGRAVSGFAATYREYRGRGLAGLCKHHTLAKAADAGITHAVTGNDETNAPMLAINRRLGYRPFATAYRWRRER